MQRSVATHSLAVKAPPLKDRALMVKGAGHYEIGCRPCHGSPESRQLPPVARAMTPHPPELFRELPKWNAKQLFYIVKHGVKFTGMPAWPAQQRDDEVWAVVAFLLELPWLTAGEYRRLVSGQNSVRSEDAPLKDLAGPEKRPPALIESCAACHGLDGRGRGLGSFPKLAGQRPTYLSASLQAYAHGQRHSGIMQPIAAGLSSEAIRVTARYYTDLIGSFQPQAAGAPLQRSLINEPGQYGHGATDTAAIERGREIAARGIPPQGVPSCIDCHGPGTALRNPIYPNLAGQYADYLILQLELFQAQRRGGTPYAHIMRRIAGRLNHSQMRDVALYYSSLTSTDGALRE